jgi:hypothetical protein
VTNVAGQVSHQRTLHWKSADDWLAYNREFGRFTPTDAWLNSVTKSADHYALMKVFGSKPKETFEELIAYAKNKIDGRAGAPCDRQARTFAEEPFRGCLGRGRSADRQHLERRGRRRDGRVAAVQARIHAVRDAPGQRHDQPRIVAARARFPRAQYVAVVGYFQGAEGSAKREVAELLHTGILGRLRAWSEWSVR